MGKINRNSPSAERIYIQYVNAREEKRKWLLYHAKTCTIEGCHFKKIAKRIIHEMEKGRIK